MDKFTKTIANHLESFSQSPSTSLERIWDLISQPGSILALGAGWLVLVRVLRYQRMSRTNARFPTRENLAKMTIKEAQAIAVDIGQYEMPFIQKKGLSFALFRTYGIPSISSLLVETSVFTKPESASKRFADTAMLLSEQLARETGSKNWVEATSRMNCIHQRYQVAGKISNEDMIYTLALFAGETIAWINRYEWRELSDVEKCALALFWSFQGEAMGIQWRGLPTYDAGKKWRDGLHFLEEWLDWAHDYEVRYMVPAETNFQTAEQTTAILLWTLPDFLKPLGRKAVIALMDDRLRIAMKYPPAPSWIVTSIYSILRARAFLIRHFFLPRFYWSRYSGITKDADENGRFFNLDWDALPYYVKPTLWNRWGPGAMLSRLNHVPVPGDQGQKFCPMGYSVPDLGPGHGKKDQKAMEEKVRYIGERGHVYFEDLKSTI